MEFVKNQERFHIERAEHFASSKFRKNKHIETAGRFAELAAYLGDSSQNRAMLPDQMPLSLTQSDIADLPEELINELSISDSDKAEFVILDILRDNGGILSLDQLLVKFYRETGEIIKRPAMTNRLYRMAQKGLVNSVPGKKGIYTTSRLDADSSANPPNDPNNIEDNDFAWLEGNENEQNA